MQINNLKIKYSKLYKKWQIRTPDRRVIEEFTWEDNAIKYAELTKDFIRIKK